MERRDEEPEASAEAVRILSVTNQKGGVGKTALALHLALAGRERGLRVLLVDLDTQANASLTLGRDPALPYRAGGAATLFGRGGIEPPPTPSGVDLLHGHQRLDGVDSRLSLEEARPIEERVRTLPYELVVIDTPPAIGLRHVAPILWCDRCVVPLEPNGYSVAGLAQTLRTLEMVREVRPGFRNQVVINRHIRRSRRQSFYIEEIGARVPLVEPYLALRVAVADALDVGLPVWRFPRATRDTKRQWQAVCGGVLDALDA